MIVKCANCGKEFNICPSRAKAKTNCCSKKCESEFRIKNSPLNCKCDWCGKLFHRSKKWMEQNKNNFCSYKCSYEFKKINFRGANNHQYGLRGKLNPTWKSDEKISNYGYKMIRVLEHPFCNCDGFVFEHRLIAEKYLLNDENSIEIDGEKYLKKEYIVHHKDKNRLNNNIENLEVMKKSEHSSRHSAEKLNEIKRDSLGRFLPRKK